MSPRPAGSVPCAKGAICYCLDEFSQGRGARTRVSALRKAIADLAPADYAGLTDVFDRHLVSHVISSADARQRIREHLNRFWFDASSRSPFFPGIPVSRIYAEGLLRTLDLSLAGGGRTVPINSW